jgi:hypothetical protein
VVDHAKYIADVKRYSPNADDAVIERIIKHLGIALRSKDASLVAGTDPGEMKRVRESWCKKKLGVTDSDADIDAACKAVVTRMKADRDKQRVTVYYLLAEHYKKLDSLKK